MQKIIFRTFPKLLRQFIKVGCLLILTSFLSSFAACQPPSTKQKPPEKQEKTSIPQQPITDGFFNLLSEEPVKLNVALKEIRRSNKSRTFPKAAVKEHSGSRRKFINEELNSRLPFALGDGVWKIKWQADLPQSFTHSAVLEINERIIVESDGIWSLFDQNGKKLLHDQIGASGVIADDENFYAADSTGLIFARRLSDGGNVFGLSLYFGNAFERIFMLRQDRNFLAVSTERELDPQTPDTIENSLIELVDLGKPLKTDDDGLLKSAKPLAHLVRKTKLLLTAAHDKTLVFATENRVYTADSDLNIEQALTGKFIPLTMSLDDSGRIYLIVKRKDRHFLWRLLPTGELEIELELPPQFEPAQTPPVIGYNYQIYILGHDKILAVNPEGKLIWQNSPEKKIGGASVTKNEQLLISAENELLAFDTKGRKNLVFALPDDSISTPPILTTKGEILLASKKYLYCLTSK